MKIQIDTKSKIIKLEGREKLSDLFDFLEKIFPHAEWEDYSIETNTVINNWSNPVIIERRTWPYYNPLEITCSGTSTGMTTNGGELYNSGTSTAVLNFNVN